MPITPFAPPLPTNANGVSTRRAAPTKGAVTNKWPLIAATAYTKLARLGAIVVGDTELEGLNPKLVRLATARNRLFQAIQAIDRAMRETNPQAGGSPDKDVYNKLRSQRAAVEKAFGEFPLEVR